MTPIEKAVLGFLYTINAAPYVEGITAPQLGRVLERAGWGKLSRLLAYRTLYRLGRGGYVTKDRGMWKLTQAGSERWRREA